MKIYSLSCPITNEIRYIGFTSRESLQKRFSEHITPSALVKSNKKNNWIKSLLKKNLKPIIEFVDDCTESNWQERESFWIYQFKAWGFKLLNETYGGEGTLGYKQSDTHKMMLWLANKNKIISSETKLKMSDSAKLRKHSEKTKLKIGLIRKGKYHSEETKLQMSNSAKGKTVSEETRAKMSLIRKGVKLKFAPKKGKKVIMYSLELIPLEKFDKIILAEKSTGISATSINNNLKNKTKSAGGFVWKYE